MLWSGFAISFCLLTNSACSQGLFREPEIPEAKTIDSQTVSRNRQGRFGDSTHLTSSQSQDFGVRQSGSLPQSSSSLRSAVTPDFVQPQSKSSVSGNRKLTELESVEGIESYSGGYGQDETGRDSVVLDRGIGRTSDGREIIVQRYPDGKPQIEREVAQDAAGNYFNHGPWRVYSRKGNVIARGQYRQGDMHGLWERKHSKKSSGLFSTKPFSLFQGPFTSTATFKNNELDGMWTLTDQYERKIFEVPYTHGQRDGTATWWYPTMTKMREVTFRSGTIDGKLLEWDEQNKLTRDEKYLAGKKVIREVTFYRPKQKQTENYFLDAKLEIDGEDNWWDAQPAAMTTAGKRLQHGPTISWYDNGLPKMKGQYSSGNRVGQFKWWHDNGNKQLQGAYERGKKIGLWTWRHENGMKKIEGNYEDGQPVGIWRWWQADGTIEAEEDLSKDSTIESGLEIIPDSQAGGPDNPAPLPEGTSQPIEINSPQETDDSPVPNMIEGHDLEGIEPLDFNDEDRDDDASDSDVEILPEDFFADD